MKIYVDADACPVIKIVERIAKKHDTPCTLLCDTNHVMNSDYSEVVIVGVGMAITINIYYTGTNGSARKFAEEMISTGVVKAIRKEAGNLKYDYFFPMDDTETVLLIDSWENQDAIDVHHDTPMMAEIMKLREKYDLHMRVERYVADDAGVPKSDQVFIRN